MSQLAAGAFQSGTVKVWEAATWRELFVLGADKEREAQVQATPAARRTTVAAARTVTAVANSTATPLPAQATTTAQAHQSFLDVTSHWHLLLSDSFDAEWPGWTTGAYDAKVSDNSQSIAGGKYRWEIKSKQVSALAFVLPAGLPTATPLKEFAVSVDGHQVGGAANSRYGLVFRYGVESHTFYLFDIADDGA